MSKTGASRTPVERVPMRSTQIQPGSSDAGRARLPDRFEIVQGEVVPLPPTGDVHGWVEARVGRVLDEQGGDQGLGATLVGEVGIVVEREPQTVRGADAAYVLASQFPCQRSREGYLLTPPALVVEVVSPNDRASEVQQKVLEYLAAGVLVVWLVDSTTLTMTVHLPDASARILKAKDPLQAPGVMDFSLTVGDLFKGLEAFQQQAAE